MVFTIPFHSQDFVHGISLLKYVFCWESFRRLFCSRLLDVLHDCNEYVWRTPGSTKPPLSTTTAYYELKDCAFLWPCLREVWFCSNWLVWWCIALIRNVCVWNWNGIKIIIRWMKMESFWRMVQILWRWTILRCILRSCWNVQITKVSM